jgi:hypothetical protein
LRQFGKLVIEPVEQTPKGGMTVAEGKPKERKDERKDGEDTSEFEKFEEFVKKIARVPKEELDKRRAEYERKRKEKQAG